MCRYDLGIAGADLTFFCAIDDTEGDRMLVRASMLPSLLMLRCGGGLRVPEGDSGASPAFEGRAEAGLLPPTTTAGWKAGQYSGE